MNVLILGGTSFFGKEIVRLFSEAGHSVTIFTRGMHKPTDLPPHQQIIGDRENLPDLQKAAEAESWDVVIDNIAFNGSHVRSALKAFSGTSHYILCSTISVYRYVPGTYSQPLREDMVQHDYQPPGEDLKDVHWIYARGKLEAEKECLKQRKVPWTILRPPVVYGPEDPTERGFWYVARLLHGGPLLIADSGSMSFRIISAVDTARAFLQVAENRKKVLRKSYFIAQGEITTLRDFIEETSHALGLVPDLIDVPANLLGEMAGPYANMVNLIPDISAAKKDFGFSPTPYTDFIRTTAEWFRDHHGDPAKILGTRQKELEFATKWKKLVKDLKQNA